MPLSFSSRSGIHSFSSPLSPSIHHRCPPADTSRQVEIAIAKRQRPSERLGPDLLPIKLTFSESTFYRKPAEVRGERSFVVHDPGNCETVSWFHDSQSGQIESSIVAFCPAAWTADARHFVTRHIGLGRPSRRSSELSQSTVGYVCGRSRDIAPPPTRLRDWNHLARCVRLQQVRESAKVSPCRREQMKWNRRLRAASGGEYTP